MEAETVSPLDKYILRFDISMDNTFFVKAMKRVKSLTKDY